jgi:hypothetical protein
LPKPACPVVAIIGPAGNGARDHVAALATPGDIIIDLSAIITELSGVHPAKADKGFVVAAIARRNEMLADLAKHPPAGTAWLITGAPKAWQRRFWQDQIGATIVLLDPGKTAAIIAARDDGVEERFVHQWYAEAAAIAGAHDFAAAPATDRAPSSKRGYGKGSGTQSHAKARDAQLLREPHCRFCWAERRVKVPATVLDHEKPFRKADGTMDFKLWGDPANHRSLCKPCHDARGATSRRTEKPPGAAATGQPLDPAHPWNRAKL